MKFTSADNVNYFFNLIIYPNARTESIRSPASLVGRIYSSLRRPEPIEDRGEPASAIKLVQRWRQEQPQVTPQQLIFLDEAGAKTSMASVGRQPPW